MDASEEDERVEDEASEPADVFPAVGPDGLSRVLVVASEPAGAELRAKIETAGFLVRGVREPSDAADVSAHWKPHVALIEADLPSPSAAELIASVRERHACPCVLLASAPSGSVVTLAAEADADALIVPPYDTADLRRTLARVARSAEAEKKRASVRGIEAKPVELPSLVVGSSPEMRDVFRLVAVAARSDSSVVVTGETGVGKEVVARALHRFSGRRAGAFVAVNCAALPETLLESELFGHEKGAFTGATGRRKGRFELATGGTLFLDEIGDLPLGLQVKLLRVLQEQSFERVGGTDTVEVDVRVVAATHHDLDVAVREGRFRADLYYRLKVLSIRVPPLRERKGDILGLWDHFISQGSASLGGNALSTSQDATRVLLRHDWPGNVRELHNVAQHCLTVVRGDTVEAHDLPPYLRPQALAEPRKNLVGLTMREVEKAAILETYEALGTVRATAEALEISQRKIHYRLKEYREEAARRERGVSADEAQKAKSQKHKRRILLAEDDDDLRWALTDVLETEGYEVVAVRDGRALLQHLGAAMLLEKRDAPPDLIITDVRMPGLTGMELLEGVRNRGWTTPVVVISAFGDDETRSRARDLGATAFLDKPIDVAALHRVVGSAVDE